MDDQFPIGLEALGLLQHADARQSLLHVTASERRAEALARFLNTALPERPVEYFPPWDCLPFDSASPTPVVMGQRMAVLRRLQETRSGCIVIVPLSALLQRLPPRDAIRSYPIRQGQRLDVEALATFCREGGYEADDRIDEPGEVAFHGGTVEIFHGGETLPCRIEMTDGQVTAIRRYDPVSQRSFEEAEAIEVVPVTELPPLEGPHVRGTEHRLPRAYEHLVTLLDQMPDARLTASAAALDAADVRLTRIAEIREDAAQEDANPLPADALYLGRDEWAALAKRAVRLSEPEYQPVPAFAAERRPRRRLSQFLADQADAGRRLLMTGRSEGEVLRLQRMVRQAGGPEPQPVRELSQAAGHKISALVADLDGGFVSGDLALVTARDLLGSRAEQADQHAGGALPWQLQATGLELGDVVVHEDHGLARLDGVEPLDAANPGAEAIRLVFANDENLLVPAHDAGRIWRYGSDAAGVKLDRLRGSAWQKRREATQEALARLAERLVVLARDRTRATASVCEPPARDYERFVARFPYPATPDQLQAVRLLRADMASGHPMDRLVIGDVGFGKTEIALRAAAVAALSGRQVAVAAPTTVLARQHFDTFRRRFAPLGIKVGHLSRLTTGKPAAEVRAGLADGSIRIAVGTHALVGKGVRFADLGLLVIDEEQRFGAAQKQKLRDLGQQCHVLSMSATPIPRTLQMALVGLQDLSVIATPPARRRPIRTLIAQDDNATLRQALQREHRRGGQSFVVVPRVEDIAAAAARLRQLVPDLRLQIAHGDLPAREIDATMVAFAQGEGDILLATSIIESGLDVARANTMLVMRPALFGLAQLHQLRGRVGRSAVQAYCYLLTAEDEVLGDDARKRLGTLQALDRLGAGMAISLADLDRRGAGDLLGDQQAGHVRRVGLGLYQEMLATALRRAKGEPGLPPLPQVLGEAGYIPADHIPEPETRIDLYHRIARALLPGEVEQLVEEITDRFGASPPPLQILLRAATVRTMAGSLGVEKVSLGPEGVALDLRDDLPAEDVRRAVGQASELDRLDDGRLLLRRPAGDPEEQLSHAVDLLELLA